MGLFPPQRLKDVRNITYSHLRHWQLAEDLSGVGLERAMPVLPVIGVAPACFMGANEGSSTWANVNPLVRHSRPMPHAVGQLG